MGEVLRRARRAARDTREKPKVTPSCGCVFCDLALEPDADGFHRGENFAEPCGLSNGGRQ
jgi:hypothetical protein